MKTTKEMEELGWLKVSTAKANYLENPALQAEYDTYDNYAISCYNYVKGNWSTGSIANYNEPLTNKSNLDIEVKTEEQKIKVSNYIEGDIDTPWINGLEKITIDKYTIDQRYKLSKIKKLKAKQRKEMNNAARFGNSCPNCLSSLVTNKLGILECSGNRLRIWENEFLKYNKLSEKEKKLYLIGISYSSLFLDLLEKWNVVDEHGRRVSFNCGYTNKLCNPVSRFRTSVPDPIAVRIIEKNLKRELTEEEKRGEVDIWYIGGIYTNKYKKGAKKIKITNIVFPDGFI